MTTGNDGIKSVPESGDSRRGSGLRPVISRLMAHPAVYTHVTRRLRGKNRIRKFVDSYIRPHPWDRILDIGCGPGDLLNFLPDVEYYGFDLDPNYIEAARKRFGSRGTFLCRPVSRDAFSGSGSFDIIVAMGILHHLDDEEAGQLFDLAHQLLKPGGRLVTYDGCYTKNQSPAARFFLGIDRGKHVRDEPEYQKLAGLHFREITTSVREDLLNIPYTIIIMECKKEGSHEFSDPMPSNR